MEIPSYWLCFLISFFSLFTVLLGTLLILIVKSLRANKKHLLNLLKEQAVKYLNTSIVHLSDKKLRTILAYEYWKDGCNNIKFINSVWHGKLDRASIIMTLKKTFGYTNL